jgi:hypothetical protein
MPGKLQHLTVRAFRVFGIVINIFGPLAWKFVGAMDTSLFYSVPTLFLLKTTKKASLTYLTFLRVLTVNGPDGVLIAQSCRDLLASVLFCTSQSHHFSCSFAQNATELHEAVVSD